MRPRIVSFFQELLGTGAFVPDFAFMIAVAIIIGLYLAVTQSEEAGVDARKIFRASVIIIITAIISARLFVVIQHFDYYTRQPLSALLLWKGDTASSGAYIGGAIAAIVAARWQGMAVTRLLDLCAPSVALAMAIGRAGCFLNGCCYGATSNLPWAMRFPQESGPYEDHLYRGLIAPGELSLPVHPTQLYEAIYGLMLFYILVRYRKKMSGNGELAALLFILYPIGRFLSEFLRADPRGSLLMFSLPQFFSLIMLILAASFLMIKRRRLQQQGAAAI